MKKDRLILNAGLIGAIIAFTTLIILLIIHLNIECDYINDLKSLMSTGSADAAIRIQENSGILNLSLGIDNLFLIGQVFVWLGFFVLVKRHGVLKAWIVLVCGITGVMMDFMQNLIEYYVIGLAGPGLVFGQTLYSVWNIVTVLSYLVAYAAGIILVSVIVQKNWKSRVVCSAFVLFSVAAITGVFFDALYPASFLWYVAFFVISGVVFIRNLKSA